MPKLFYRFVLFLPFPLLFFSCEPTRQSPADCLPVSHAAWTLLLQNGVGQKGRVNYRYFLQHKPALEAYLNTLGRQLPSPNWNRNAQMAFWINTYNAFTVKLILENYPLGSIKDLNPKVAVPLVNTVWDKNFICIGKEKFSLNHIEHRILRRQFEDPRIHFAINCASVSCPDLRNEAYEGSKLDAQLDEQARLFLNDPAKNKITPKKAMLSPIFNWFESDFTRNGSLITFINRYSEVKANATAEISYLPYNWNLNNQK
jgi:hypothetical protein